MKTVFLDSCIFFECIEDPRNQTVLNHAINLGYTLVTSITGIGETVDQMRKRPDRSDFILAFINLYENLRVFTYYPDPIVADVCYHLANLEIDYRVEKTDRVHLGYAIAYGCDYFLTSDKNLIKYRVPHALEEVKFFKPKTITLEEFKERL